MKKCFCFIFSSFALIQFTYAQQPDDALKLGWYIPNGTARNIAIGGAMGSLGGDITANNVNPAGLGLYKINELTISPCFNLNNNKISYLGNSSILKKNALQYGATGVIFGAANNYSSAIVSSAFSISVNQLASYNNHTHYKGSNNYSSYSEQYLEELIRDNASLVAAESNYIFGSTLAYRTYLIDSSNANGQLTGYKSLVPVGTGITQERDEDTRGGLHEIAIAAAGNVRDKFYFGIGLNILVLSYNSDLVYTETDATSNPDNNFAFSTFTDHKSTNGAGVNFKLGLIYKTAKGLRFGFALHTPSAMQLTDIRRAEMTTNTEAYAGLRTVTSDELNSGNAGQQKYRVITPYRAIGSVSYVFNAVENTKKQRGFITADVEYVNYRGVRYSVSAENQDDLVGVAYYDALNLVIKDYYKGNINVRVGGELKLDPIAIRLGAAYYGSPYADDALKAKKLMAAAGIGYRNHGYFIDITFAQSFNDDVNFPYRLNDKANIFATTNNSKTSVLATVGFKF